MISMRQFGTSLWSGLIVFSFAVRALSADSLSVKSASNSTQWTFSYSGKPILVYESDPHKYKPYIKSLSTIKGDNLLLDGPGDHLHHHGLMYAVKVNGINFWEEASGSGVQRPMNTSAKIINSGAEGVLEQDLVWVPAVDAFLPLTNCGPLLVERRSLTLKVSPGTGEVALLWQSSFRVGSRTNTVVLTGSNYHGLGIRFLRELDPLAEHFSPAGLVDLKDRQDTSVWPWEAVRFDVPGKPATVAMFGSPANTRGAPRFFSMAKPFAYLSATQTLDKEPLVYHDGDTFQLDYLVLVYPEKKNPEALAARFGEFEKRSRQN